MLNNHMDDKDIQIKILTDSYHLVIGSKWWKMTKGLRYIQEVIQKHILHKKTMSETLAEIADLDRYRPNPLVLSSSYEEGKSYHEKVSVVIPTFNAGEEFKSLLMLLQAQKGIGDIEVIIVDSGSKDDTVALSEQFGAKVICITQEEFSHSYARNLGAKHATGEYVLFMTQDAEPTDDTWVYRLLSVLKEHNVAATSPMEIDNGRGGLKCLADAWSHIKYIGVQESDKLTSYEEGMSAHELRQSAQLSDVSCMIKKEIFDQYGYEGDYAEDLSLGIKLIQDGYSLAQLHSVQVKHAHKRSPGYLMKRAYVDVRALARILGEDTHSIPGRNELLTGICNGYVDTCTYIAGLQDQLRQACDIKECCMALEESMGIVKMRSGELDFGHIYSDEFSDEVINKLAACRQGDEIIEKTLFEQVKFYVRNVLIPYLQECKEQVEEADKQEILEAVFKAYASEVGLQMGVYSMDYEDDLTDLASEWFKGV